MPVSPVASPCIDICRIDPVSGWCEGCLRTLDEIAEWSGFDDVAKQAVCDRLPARRAEAGAASKPTPTPTPTSTPTSIVTERSATSSKP